ncbi:hypothetical protein B0H16DRAFT_1764534 [Mycena metata]|uniref:CxC5 like cysteine cluster associated with KDZ domain-containing protein n=1 Tax=Mycena metata TaxID=1033252 RepID=A0AAD7I635_9AGAR|nr:hypothetical protein B0H16DRAFT_1764534 [Mycena metata]
MPASVRQLIFILQLFFPAELAVQQAIYVLGVLISLYPLFRLHSNQLSEARRQSPRTGWKNTIRALITGAFCEEANGVEAWPTGISMADEYADYICSDLEAFYTQLGLFNASAEDLSSFEFRRPRPVLTTTRLDCKFCPPGDRNLVPSLRRRRRDGSQTVWLLDASFQWLSADLVIAYCAKCRAEYYPDIITRPPGPGSSHRSQELEYNAEYLRVSKSGIWVHRKIAVAQEKALNRFHSGWSNFADWVNDSTNDLNVKFTYRQSKRLFLEHFARRLLKAHDKADGFTCEAHASAESLATAVREVIGENGGFIPTAMSHGCMDCTHVKRYKSDLVREGAVLGGAGDGQIADSEAGPAAQIDPALLEQQPLPANLPPTLAQQETPPDESPRGHIRLAVMDGKSLKYRKCAIDDCRGPLVNYKNGRFCETHLHLRDICGIVPCGRPVRTTGALTCNTQSHIDWHKQYDDRFHRLSFPGVQRVIRRQNAEGTAGIQGPSLQVQLQALGDIPGENVVHTFKAKSIYCLQTVQWACGMPIGWGKCYRSESTPQVLAILNTIWEDYPESRPSFMVYDKACDLLRHIVTQNPNDLWLRSTKFIVDAWHYIGHRATDILCRTRCNPAPTDGTQPDLVLAVEDNNGVTHQTRAFNTETAEQLNSWLNGFESQLRQMTEVNYDFFIHVLMLIYGENVEKRVVESRRELSDEFWDKVNGVVDMDVDNDS